MPPAQVSCWTDTSQLRDLDFDGEEGIWAATPGGLLRLDLVSGTWRVWTAAQGLPSSQVRAVLRVSSGHLWVGTDRGAARFDGRRFTVWGAAEAGLPSPAVTCLAEGPDGTVYAGTERGAARFREGRWESFDDTHEFARREVRDIAVDADGTVWVAKENALSHWVGGRRWETFQRNVLAENSRVDLISNSLLSLAVDGRGAKWLGTKMGLDRYDGRTWRHFHYLERMALRPGLDDNWIETVAAAPDGSVWVGHGRSRDFDRPAGAARLLPGGSWRYLTSSDGLPSDAVWKIRVAPDGLVWLAASGGLAVWDGAKVRAWAAPSALPGNRVEAVAPAGGTVKALLAAGTFEMAGGAWRPADGFPQPLPRPDTEPPPAPPPLAERYGTLNRLVRASDGTLCLSSPAGLWRRRSGAWEEIPTPVARGALWSAAWDDRGRLFAGGRDGGLFVLDGGRWRELRPGGLPAPPGITAIVPDRGAVWLATASHGLMRLTDR